MSTLPKVRIRQPSFQSQTDLQITVPKANFVGIVLIPMHPSFHCRPSLSAWPCAYLLRPTDVQRPGRRSVNGRMALPGPKAQRGTYDFPPLRLLGGPPALLATRPRTWSCPLVLVSSDQVATRLLLDIGTRKVFISKSRFSVWLLALVLLLLTISNIND